MKTTTCIAVISFFIIGLSACEKNRNAEAELMSSEPKLPQTAYNYQKPKLPGHANIASMLASEVNDKTATLGRVLFYDKQLSINNAVSCASCHNQVQAFADGRQSSAGFINAGTPRNSMHIVNLISQNAFFWDVRESNLESMVLKPIQNHVEMGFEKMDYLVNKLNRIVYYKELFTNAFGSETVNEERISKALTQFLKSMVSYNSKFDQGMASNFTNFNASERNGHKLFTQKLTCSNCHSGIDLNGWGGSVANIGLDFEYKDKGVDFRHGDRFFSTTLPGSTNADPEGFFKIPSLRNVALTGPYMHDGRFNTLEEVVEHYNSGVKDHKYLNWELFDLPSNPNEPFDFEHPKAKKWNLTDQEKADLVAFLKTLTDYSFTFDERFSNPFVISK